MYAMWSRSKRILYILLLIYVLQVIISFVFAGIFDSKAYTFGMSWTKLDRLPQSKILLLPFCLVTTVQIGNFNTCAETPNNIPLISTTHLADGSLWFVLSVVLLVLAVTPTIKESVEMFKATKQWQPNKYMQQLVTEGILYFLVYASLFYFLLFPICSISFKCLHKN